MRVTITADRAAIFDQVARTTGCAGAKLLDRDGQAYERMSSTGADEVLMGRLWQESRDCLCDTLRRLIEAEGMEGETYRLDLNLSEAFDAALLASVNSGVEAYFVNAVTARWLCVADKDKAADYESAASQMLADIRHKVMCKRPPRRPRYVGSRHAAAKE